MARFKYRCNKKGKFLLTKKIKQLCFKLANIKSFAKKKKFLKSYGFKYLASSNGSAEVFKSEKDKLILKLNGIFDSQERIPYYAAPTLILDWWTEDDDGIVRIQPVVDISNAAVEKAMQFAELRHDRGFGSDVHDYNVGLYKGKPVTFDW